MMLVPRWDQNSAFEEGNVSWSPLSYKTWTLQSLDRNYLEVWRNLLLRWLSMSVQIGEGRNSKFESLVIVCIGYPANHRKISVLYQVLFVYFLYCQILTLNLISLIGTIYKCTFFYLLVIKNRRSSTNRRATPK